MVAQRSSKILGIFASRLDKRDGKPHHRRHAARMASRKSALAHPVTPVSALVQKQCPRIDDRRRRARPGESSAAHPDSNAQNIVAVAASAKRACSPDHAAPAGAVAGRHEPDHAGQAGSAGGRLPTSMRVRRPDRKRHPADLPRLPQQCSSDERDQPGRKWRASVILPCSAMLFSPSISTPSARRRPTGSALVAFDLERMDALLLLADDQHDCQRVAHSPGEAGRSGESPRRTPVRPLVQPAPRCSRRVLLDTLAKQPAQSPATISEARSRASAGFA